MAGRRKTDFDDSGLEAKYGGAAGRGVLAMCEVLPALERIPEEKYVALLQRVERSLYTALETKTGGLPKK